MIKLTTDISELGQKKSMTPKTISLSVHFSSADTKIGTTTTTNSLKRFSRIDKSLTWMIMKERTHKLSIPGMKTGMSS